MSEQISSLRNLELPLLKILLHKPAFSANSSRLFISYLNVGQLHLCIPNAQKRNFIAVMKAVKKLYTNSIQLEIRLPLCMVFSLLLFKKKIQIPPSFRIFFLSFLFSRWNQIDLCFLIWQSSFIKLFDGDLCAN